MKRILTFSCSLLVAWLASGCASTALVKIKTQPTLNTAPRRIHLTVLLKEPEVIYDNGQGYDPRTYWGKDLAPNPAKVFAAALEASQGFRSVTAGSSGASLKSSVEVTLRVTTKYKMDPTHMLRAIIGGGTLFLLGPFVSNHKDSFTAVCEVDFQKKGKELLSFKSDSKREVINNIFTGNSQKQYSLGISAANGDAITNVVNQVIGSLDKLEKELVQSDETSSDFGQ